MTRNEARNLAERHGIPLDKDFHALPSDTVRSILAAADERKYRAPASANGSRARYFYALLCRDAKQEAHWLDEHIEAQAKHYGLTTDQHAALTNGAAQAAEMIDNGQLTEKQCRGVASAR